LLGFDTNETKLLFEIVLQFLRLPLPLSNIILFLVVQMIQQEEITISLKIGLPKVVLASIIISRG